MEFSNAYQDARRAEAYARLEFPGTYYLAYRDLPDIIFLHVAGRQALDFGCGTGRSTRFLKNLGFQTVGVDVSPDMIKLAREKDPHGEYRLVGDGDLSACRDARYDLVLSVFTFDNIPTREKKVRILHALGMLLLGGGTIVNVVSSPEIYTHEWASFTTREFPENRRAKCGDRVRIVITDVDDRRPVEDVIWPDEDYRTVYEEAGLEPVRTYRPLARADEPYRWVNETTIPPWVIYVLKKE